MALKSANKYRPNARSDDLRCLLVFVARRLRHPALFYFFSQMNNNIKKNPQIRGEKATQTRRDAKKTCVHSCVRRKQTCLY